MNLKCDILSNGDFIRESHNSSHRDRMTLETRQLAYRDEDARLNGFLAVDPTLGDKRPGILVVHGAGPSRMLKKSIPRGST